MTPPIVRPRRIRRSRNDKLVAGVAGGLAEYFGVDSAWVRLGFVVLVLAGVGFPVVFYLLAWLIVPRSDEPSDLSRDRLHRSRENRVLGGVCGGLAETLGIDATLVRLIAAVLLLTGGIGVPLYLLAWVILPPGPQAPLPPAVL